MGITYDNITGTHEITFGKPNPSACVSCGMTFKETNKFIFDLAEHPPNLLPSGGSSNIASMSEMVMCMLKEENYTPKTDLTVFEWHKAAGIHNTDKIIYNGTGNDYQEEPGWTWYYSYDLCFIGRFDWEINEPGFYYVLIKADQGRRGTARIDFEVINSAPAATINSYGFGDYNGEFAGCSPAVKGSPIYIYTHFTKTLTPNVVTLNWQFIDPSGILKGGKFMIPSAANNNGVNKLDTGLTYQKGDYKALKVFL